MIVVIDSNQFHGDPKMRGHNFRVVLGQHERRSIRVVIPEVVAREVPKMFATRYKLARDQMIGAAKTLRDIDHDFPLRDLPEPDTVGAEYADWLRRHLAARKIDVAPLPTIDLDGLVTRSLDERRPFRSESRGFRDAVIWDTVRELAAEDVVVLITKNHKDFAESDKQPARLHRQLREDLNRAGIDEGRVILVRDLTSFIEEHVPPVEKAAELAIKLQTEDAKWANELSDKLQCALWTLSIDKQDSVTVVDSENASIDNLTVEDSVIEDFAIVDAYPIDADGGLVSLEVRVEAILFFGFTVETGGAEWLIHEGAGIEIDVWEETFAQGRTEARYVEVTYAVDFDLNTHRLGDLEKVIAIDR